MIVLFPGLYAVLQSGAALITSIGFGSTVASAAAVGTYATLRSAAGPVGLAISTYAMNHEGNEYFPVFNLSHFLINILDTGAKVHSFLMFVSLIVSSTDACNWCLRFNIGMDHQYACYL